VVIEKLIKYRFELFFISIVCILFGSLFFPDDIFADRILPILFLINILSGFLFFINRKKKAIVVILLFITLLSIFLFNTINKSEDVSIRYIKLIAYFLFYILVTFQIIRQVWSTKRVNRSVIFGLMSGYVSIGLLGFFTFFSIELSEPGSFNGLLINLPVAEKIDQLIYFSYITIMSIGYGDISPVTVMAQKATVLFGMIGQFYLVIITAVVIEKYIRHTQKP
jgi:voltage-gated potassium channel